MKNLEQKAIEQLLCIVPDDAALSIMQFSEEADDLSLAIKALCQEKEYDFQLNLLTSESLEETKKIESEICKVNVVKWEQRRYASTAKFYQNIFISTSIPKEKEEAFIDNIIPSIKNTGTITLFLPKNDPVLVEHWWRLLEDKLFVAISTIDIFKEHEILVAKKMHGWGS